MRRVAKDVLLVLLLGGIVAFFSVRFPPRRRGTDFPAFYAAARMVLEGHGHELYDAAAQNHYLARDAGRGGIYFFHPPFEALLYLPFAGFSLAAAYALWCAFNAILLTAAARSLVVTFAGAWDWRILLPLSLLFVPLLLTFFQGQDSMLLLFLITAAIGALHGNRRFTAGCLLGCGMFKFHLVLPVAALFLVLGRKRFLAGFLLVVGVLVLVCNAISGPRWVFSYFSFLAGLTKVPLVGIHDQQMANLRGLFGTLLPAHHALCLTLVLISSAIVMSFAVHAMLRAADAGGKIRLASTNAIVASLLVGYHLSPHDLTILLLPLALLTQHILTDNCIPQANRIVLAVLIGTLFLPPLHLLLLAKHVYTYACIPLLLFLGVVLLEIRRIAAAQVRETASQVSGN